MAQLIWSQSQLQNHNSFDQILNELHSITHDGGWFWYQILQTHLPLKTGLQGQDVQELINAWLNLHLIHVGH